MVSQAWSRQASIQNRHRLVWSTMTVLGPMLSKKSAFRLERRVWRSRDVRSGDLMPLKLLLSGPTFSQTVRAVGWEAAPGHVTPGS